MSSQPIRECRFLIPLRRDNETSDGESHEISTWRWLDEELMTRFDGRTKSTAKLQGVWKNPATGTITSDESILFLVAVDQDRLDELREVLSVACIRFAQQCIYLSVAGYVEFVGPKT